MKKLSFEKFTLKYLIIYIPISMIAAILFIWLFTSNVRFLAPREYNYLNTTLIIIGLLGFIFRVRNKKYLILKKIFYSILVTTIITVFFANIPWITVYV